MDVAAYAIYSIVLRNPHASAIEQQRCNARRTWYWQLVLDIRLCAICIAFALQMHRQSLVQNWRLHLRIECSFVLTDISATECRWILTLPM